MTSSEILMVVFTAVIAVTGVIGAIIFGKQLNAMQGQLDAMEVDQRPWVSVTTELNGPLAIRRKPTGELDGIIFSVKLLVKNVGRSPAMNLHLVADSSLGDNDPLIFQNISCENAKKNNNPILTSTVFPGETLPPFINSFSYDANSVDRAKTQLKGAIRPVIYGCVTYTFPNRPEPHQTGFAIRLSAKDSVLDLANGSIPESDLMLFYYVLGGRFAN